MPANNLIPVSIEELKIILNDIIAAGIPIFRKNTEGSIVTLPHDKIERYIGNSPADSEFYIQKDWNERVQRVTSTKIFKTNTVKNEEITKAIREAVERYGNTFEQLDSFQKLSIEEREQILDTSIGELNILGENKRGFDVNAVIKMVEVIANTFYANYACLEDNLSSENVKDNLSGIIVKTDWMINIIIQYFKSETVSCNQYKLINSIDTGSITMDKMCKGLLWFIAYCLYYNDYIEQGLVTRKIRPSFNDRYLRYYRKRIPDLNISIERIIKGGFRRIDTDQELKTYAIGSLLYDIGKIPFISYYDGNEDYDENMVRIHTLTGYNLLLKAKIYPFTVIAMAAFHHEYYGGRKSYNFTNPIISKLLKRKRYEENARYFITWSDKEFIAGEALAFFPCKLIEIIDIYNGLTARNKFSVTDALMLMKKEFIAQSLKIDPLLFDIFLEFHKSCNLLTSTERNKIDSVIY